MGFNLTNEFIDQTFPQLVQISGSTLLDGTGSAITDLDFTGSHVESASHAEFADEAYSASNATNAVSANTASYIAASDIDGTVTSASSAITANSSSHAEFANSSSFALNFNPDATASYATFAESSSYATSASFAQDTISASFALNANTASHALFADSSQNTEEIFISVKNVQGSTITKGQALHATGVTGENITVITASSDISANMPAIGIAQTDINNNATGECIVSGRLKNFDTSNLVAGATVYVNSNGGLTATKPTGSDLIQNIGIAAKINATEGEIVVLGSGRSNDLPNITENYVWLGNSNQVPTAVASSSIKVDNATSASYAVSSSRSELAGSATSATSASHAVRSDIADGIATDARLNVVDITASAATFTSASIGYLQTITGSAKIIGDAFIILNNDTPTERYAGIKVIDSGAADTTASLQFDGQTNDWFYEYGGVDATDHGVAIFGPEYGTKGSPSYPTANTIQKGDGGHHLLDSSIIDNGTNVTTNLPISASGGITGSLDGNASSADTSTSASFATTASHAYSTSGTHSGNLTVTGTTRNGSTIDNNLKQNISAPGTNNSYDLVTGTGMTVAGKNYNNVNFYFADYSGFGAQFENYFSIEYYDSFSYNFGSELNVNGLVSRFSNTASGSGTGGSRTSFVEVRDNQDGTGQIRLNTGDQAFMKIRAGNKGIDVTGGVHNNITTLSISSNTASLDFQDGDAFILSLVSGSTTHLDGVNVAQTGSQTVSLRVTQPGTGYGSLTFAPEFKFAGGTAPTITAAANAEDIITFQTYAGSNVYGTSVQDLK